MTRSEARQKALALVKQMTLEEKAAQMKYNAPAIERLGVPAYNWWNEALHGVARAGTATVFPQAIGLAAIFDAEFHGQIAEAIAREARAKYNAASRHGDRDIYKGLTFWSPNVNIFRDPRWGRGQETYGEDPYLTARLGVSFVKHLQGTGKYMQAAACAKHYAVHSGPEKLRHEFDARPSKRDLWDTYLPAFEALVKEAGVESVMGAYNRVDGEPACGSYRLLTEILRGQWGFEGHVVSDCGALSDFHMRHMVTDTAPESAAMAVKAGCDLNCGNTYLHILQAIQEGLLTEADVDKAVVRLFTCRYLLGLFAEDCPFDDILPDENDTEAHAALALEAARKAMVLLKNDGVLPLNLDKLGSVAVIGPNADSIHALEGNYNGTSSRYVTFLEGIRAACAGKARVNYAVGCHLYKDESEDLGGKGDRLAEAVQAAEMSDATILCLGLDAGIEGEEGDANNAYAAGDKRDLNLPPVQRELYAALLATGKPLVVVLAAGSAINVSKGNAILCAWYPGQAGGTALADIVFGRVSPSGKLPVTFYESVHDLPEFTDYSMENRTYRYFQGTPLYPFGFGLGYADFVYENAAYDAETRTLSVDVRNAGGMDAEAVVEVYAKPEDGAIKLCAFGRVALKPGECRRVQLPLSDYAFETVDEAGVRAIRGGQYVLYVGGSQPDPQSVKLTGRTPLRVAVAL